MPVSHVIGLSDDGWRQRQLEDEEALAYAAAHPGVSPAEALALLGHRPLNPVRRAQFAAASGTAATEDDQAAQHAAAAEAVALFNEAHGLSAAMAFKTAPVRHSTHDARTSAAAGRVVASSKTREREAVVARAVALFNEQPNANGADDD